MLQQTDRASAKTSSDHAEPALTSKLLIAEGYRIPLSIFTATSTALGRWGQEYQEFKVIRGQPGQYQT